MNILLVEDDEQKARQIEAVMREVSESPTIKTVRSLTSGLQALQQAAWDLIVLDMSIPAFDISREEGGGSPQALGGRDLLRRMRTLRLSVPVVVVTQYDVFGEGESAMDMSSLHELLHREHGQSYLGTIYYNVVYDQWKRSIADIVKAVGETHEND